MTRRKRDYTPGTGRLPAVAPLASPYVPYQLEEPERYDPKIGLVRGTLYPGLDLPFMGMVNKKPLSGSAMSDMQALGFAVQEIALYLDTHKDDTEALELYRGYQKMLHNLNAEYAAHVKPLCHKDISTGSEYNWLSDPWPWEYCANKED